MWKSRRRTWQRLSRKIKYSLKKLQDENEELNGSTIWLKSKDEELQNLKQKAKIWETTERKWTKSLFLRKK